MPIKARWEQHGAYIRGSGVLPIGEVIGVRKFMLDPPEGMTPKYQIIDLSHVERLDFDQMDQLNIAMGDLKVAEKFPNIKVAFICSNPTVQKKVMDFFKSSWTYETKAAYRMFHELEKARAWIGLPYPKEKDNNFPDKNSTGSLWLPNDN